MYEFIFFTSGDLNGDFRAGFVSLLFDLTEHGVLLFKGAKVLLHSESDVVFEQSMVYSFFLFFFCCCCFLLLFFFFVVVFFFCFFFFCGGV